MPVIHGVLSSDLNGSCLVEPHMLCIDSILRFYLRSAGSYCGY